MSAAPQHLAPPPPTQINPEYNTVPLTPAVPRPPFGHYHSTSILPTTPYTPYPEQQHGGPSPYAHPPPTQPTRDGLTPYIKLPTRLLLASVSPALLPLVLTIVHLFSNRRSTDEMADSLRANMYAACTGLAKGAGALQTVPRYMAMKTNEQMIAVTQGMIRATGMGLIHMVTIIEVVVMFIIDTYRSLLMCTIELAVRGTLELMIGAVRGITEAVTASLNEIRTAIQASVSTANRVIQETVSRLSRATTLIGIDVSIPEFTIPSLSRLENVEIPNDFEQSLVRLNSTIPSLEELRTRLSAILQQPFAMLKREMNETRLELASSFNSSILPTPPMSALSAENAREMELSLCGDLDTSIVDDTAKALNKLSTVAIGLMFVLLVACWLALCGWEWYRWKCLNDTVETMEDEWKAEGQRDGWRAVAVVENPVLERYGSPILRRMARKERTRRNTRWYLSYLAHPTCLALLCISILGFLSLQFQLIALNALKSHAQSNADAAVAQSTASLTDKLNAMAFQQSREYAASYNAAVARHQQTLDERLIGSWINTTGVALNTTLVEFYDDVENIVDRAFGNTVLHNPMSTFMYCILGSKIDSLSNALTWLRDNARITLPTVPENILLLSPEAMNEMAGPVTAAAVGGGSGSGDGEGDDGGVVGKLIGHWEKSIRAEKNFYACIIGVWGFLALVGMGVVLWNSGGGERYDSWRRTRRGAENGADGAGGDEKQRRFLGIAVPGAFTPSEKTSSQPRACDNAPIYDTHAEKQFRGTEPSPNPFNDRHEMGDANDSTHPRPGTALSGLGGLAALVAPGERFLSSSGRKTPGNINDGNVVKERLVRGETSEQYSFTQQPPPLAGRFNGDDGVDDLPTPPPMWIKKASSAIARMSPLGSLFPGRSRGERNGAAIQTRQAERGDQWGGHGHRRMYSEENGSGAWDEDVTPETPLSAGFTSDERQHYQHAQRAERGATAGGTRTSQYPFFTSQPVYPRPMSRAATPLVNDARGVVLERTGGGGGGVGGMGGTGGGGARDPFGEVDGGRRDRAYGQEEDEIDMLDDGGRGEVRRGHLGGGTGETDSWAGSVGEATVQRVEKGQREQMGYVGFGGEGDREGAREGRVGSEGREGRRNPFADMARI